MIESVEFVNDPKVKEFESSICKYLKVNQAFGANFGTDALVIGLQPCDVGRGNEVITTSLSFFTTSESISSIGAGFW